MRLGLDVTGTVPVVTPDQTTTLERISLDHLCTRVSSPADSYEPVHVTVESDTQATAELTIWPDGLTSMACAGETRTRLAISSVLFALDQRPAAVNVRRVLRNEFGNDIAETGEAGTFRVGLHYVLRVREAGAVRISKVGAGRECVTVPVADAIKLLRMFEAVTNP